jgi:hypothetical protein
VDLRSKLPKRSAQLVDLFGWAGLSGSGDLIDQINKVTLWDESKSRAILTSLDALDAPYFKNKQVLVRVAKRPRLRFQDADQRLLLLHMGQADHPHRQGA